MIKKLLLLLLFIFSFIGLSFGASPINACGSIDSNGDYYLTQDISTTGYCLTINSPNVTIDMSGYSMTGDNDTADRGTYMAYTTGDFNFTLKNGVIKNFGYGWSSNNIANYKHRINFENITFENITERDVYAYGNSVSYDKIMNLTDCTFSRRIYGQVFKEINIISTLGNDVLDIPRIYLTSGSSINFHGYSGMNIGTQFYQSGGSVNFNELNDLYLQNMNWDIVNVNSDSEIDIDLVDICGSNTESLTQSKRINIFMQANDSDSGDCFYVGGNDFVIDMNGYTLTGDNDTADKTFLMMYTTGDFNFTLKNGVIKDFGYGWSSNNIADYKHRINFENIIFENITDRDVYAYGNSVNYDKIMNLTDCTFSRRIYGNVFKEINVISTLGNDVLDIPRIYLTSGSSINFHGYSGMNIGTQFYQSGGNLNFNNLKDLYLQNMVWDIVDITSDSELNIDLVDICGSNTGALTQSKRINIVMQANDSDDGDCFEAGGPDFVIDMNGYTLTGDDGTGDHAFDTTYTAGSINFTLKNGFVKDFGIVWFNNNGNNNKQRVNIDNIISDSISYRGMYANGNNINWDKAYEITNSNFITSFYFSTVKNVTIYGNNLSSANILRSSSNYYPTKIIDGKEVGNYWGDFPGCGGDTYDVSYNEYVYTVCNDTDYGPVNGVTDTAPLVGMVYVGTPLLSSGGGSVSKSNVFSFGGTFLSTLVIIFGWFMFS